MRIVGQVAALLSFGLLAACASPPPSEIVELSGPSDFSVPADNRWHKASDTRPVAILRGRAETTRVLMPRNAVLRVSCFRQPTVRVAYDVGLKAGPIAVQYRFDDKVEQKGVVRVRGALRNMVVIDNAATVTAFDAELRASDKLKVRVSRPPFEMHDAYFAWDRNDRTLAEVLAACDTRMLDAARRKPPGRDAVDDDDEDDVKDVLPEQ